MVKAGGSLIVILKSCVAVPAVFVAVTVPVKFPFAVGVPLMTPAVSIVTPVGKPPAVTAKVGAGAPLAV